jgi:hypothetical protein
MTSPPSEFIARAVSWPARLSAYLLLASAVLTLLSAGRVASSLADISAALLSWSAPAFVLVVGVVLLFHLLPGMGLLLIAKAAQRSSPWAVVACFLVSSLLAVLLCLPPVSWGISTLLEFFANPREGNVNPTAWLSLILVAELLIATFVWFVLRWWWRLFQGTYILLRRSVLGENAP